MFMVYSKVQDEPRGYIKKHFGIKKKKKKRKYISPQKNVNHAKLLFIYSVGKNELIKMGNRFRVSVAPLE